MMRWSRVNRCVRQLGKLRRQRAANYLFADSNTRCLITCAHLAINLLVRFSPPPPHRPLHLRRHFHLHLLELLSSPALPTSCPLLLFCAVHLVHLHVNVHLLARHLASLPIQPCRNSTCLFSSKMLMRQEGRITDRLPYLAQTTQLLPGNTINAASNSLRFGISDQTAAEKKHQCSRSLFLCR